MEEKVVAVAEMTPMGKQMGWIGLSASIMLLVLSPVTCFLAEADEDSIPIVTLLSILLVWIMVGFVWLIVRKKPPVAELVVTKEKVYGHVNRDSFVYYYGHIVAVTHGLANSVVLHLYSGKKFYFSWVENLDEVCNAIELCRILALPTKPSPESSSQPALHTADELKKYKELLDTGIITQEEFDAKKKQLLDL